MWTNYKSIREVNVTNKLNLKLHKIQFPNYSIMNKRIEVLLLHTYIQIFIITNQMVTITEETKVCYLLCTKISMKIIDYLLKVFF